jgi:hypothetical protein
LARVAKEDLRSGICKYNIVFGAKMRWEVA